VGKNIKLSDIIKDQPMAHDLGYHMRLFYESMGRRHDEKDGLIHPSLLASTCLKEHYYFLTGAIKRKEKPENFLLLESARYQHLRIQKHWWQMGILYGQWKCPACGLVFEALSPEECPDCNLDLMMWDEHYHPYREYFLEKPEWRMVGSADGILQMNGERSLGEIKSANTFNFARITSISISHQVQVQCYLEMSGLTKGWVVYVERGNAKWKDPILIERDPDMIKTIDKWCKTLIQAIDTETPPDFKYDKNAEYCTKRCQGRKLCKGG